MNCEQSNRNSLNAYVAEISRYPLLTREEERDLSCLVRDGNNPVAEERLIRSNLRLVVKIAAGHRKDHQDVLDLIQEGNLGLLRAAKRYDPRRGTKFSVYASFWIRAYILKYLMDTWSMVKVGNTLSERKLFYRLKREETSPELLSRELGLKESDVLAAHQRVCHRDLYLDSSQNDGGVTGLVSPREDAEDIVHRREEFRIIAKLIKDFKETLDEREAIVLDGRIIADDPSPLRELGEVLGISHERVRQIECKIMEKLEGKIKKEMYAVRPQVKRPSAPVRNGGAMGPGCGENAGLPARRNHVQP